MSDGGMVRLVLRTFYNRGLRGGSVAIICKLFMMGEIFTDPKNDLSDDEMLLYSGAFAITEESWKGSYAPVRLEL
jgi:hypothetical protein